MHEDLLGYLLGALEPHEMRRVAKLLRDDPAARDELARIEASLRPLEEDYQPPAGPSEDLVARTLASLPPLPTADDSVLSSSEEDQTIESPAQLVPMGNVSGLSPRSTSSWMDWVSGCVAVAILLGLLLPAIAQGRFESRKIACQDQLREFGIALSSFVTLNPKEHLPAVSPQGPEAFAGIYAVRLHDAGLLDNPSLRWCPSMDLPQDEAARLASVHELVPVADLHSTSVDRLKELQRVAGGHYAYNLGVVDHDRLTAPRFESRATFAVMSDAPMGAIVNGNIDSTQIGHSGRGINVLYEDGHTRFVSLQSLNSMTDHPLLNNRGQREAGVNIDDASLAPSWRPPFVNVRQR
ncbi:hypothetical protein [Planctomycetes bacterium K23_9]|uniref:Uncharacterized protein n=1 Tax=Stieleria marina TaxID=1930275 RepID=A0A517P0Q8_9BACT|nr:hypothetical protein K239x_49740 [Planctomycetes bacterium K23_9]